MILFRLIMSASLAMVFVLSAQDLTPIRINKKPVILPQESSCYTKDQHNQLDEALDKGVKCLSSLAGCRINRDLCYSRLASLKEDLKAPEVIKPKSKKGLWLKVGASFILGLIVGSSL